MGGRVWSPEEEKCFWEKIIPLSKKRKGIDAAGDERDWDDLAQVMQKTMGDKARRTYTALMLFEHYFQNAVSRRFSPHATEYVVRFLGDDLNRDLIATRGGTRPRNQPRVRQNGSVQRPSSLGPATRPTPRAERNVSPAGSGFMPGHSPLVLRAGPGTSSAWPAPWQVRGDNDQDVYGRGEDADGGRSPASASSAPGSADDRGSNVRRTPSQRPVSIGSSPTFRVSPAAGHRPLRLRSANGRALLPAGRPASKPPRHPKEEPDDDDNQLDSVPEHAPVAQMGYHQPPPMGSMYIPPEMRGYPPHMMGYGPRGPYMHHRGYPVPPHGNGYTAGHGYGNGYTTPGAANAYGGYHGYHGQPGQPSHPGHPGQNVSPHPGFAGSNSEFNPSRSFTPINAREPAGSRGPDAKNDQEHEEHEAQPNTRGFTPANAGPGGAHAAHQYYMPQYGYPHGYFPGNAGHWGVHGHPAAPEHSYQRMYPAPPHQQYRGPIHPGYPGPTGPAGGHYDSYANAYDELQVKAEPETAADAAAARSLQALGGPSGVRRGSVRSPHTDDDESENGPRRSPNTPSQSAPSSHAAESSPATSPGTSNIVVAGGSTPDKKKSKKAEQQDKKKTIKDEDGADRLPRAQTQGLAQAHETSSPLPRPWTSNRVDTSNRADTPKSRYGNAHKSQKHKNDDDAAQDTDDGYDTDVDEEEPGIV